MFDHLQQTNNKTYNKLVIKPTTTSNETYRKLVSYENVATTETIY